MTLFKNQFIFCNTKAFRGAGFIMDPAGQMDPPYFAIKEAVNQI